MIDGRGNFELSNATGYGSYDEYVAYIDTANEYNFNSKAAVPNVEVRSWDYRITESSGYYVFVKYCDGDVVDIYGINIALEV